ncbi:MAG: hypothetical protein U0798_02630 [Gemmataceae bacterium]
MIGFENGKAWPGKTVWGGMMPAESAQTTMAKAAGRRLRPQPRLVSHRIRRPILATATCRARTNSTSARSGSIARRTATHTIRYEYIDTTSEDYVFFGIVFVLVLAR